MASGNIKITADIEPIVKLGCIKFDCVNNLHNSGYDCCNLKHICIDENGRCFCFESSNNSE